MGGTISILFPSGGALPPQAPPQLRAWCIDPIKYAKLPDHILIDYYYTFIRCFSCYRWFFTPPTMMICFRKKHTMRVNYRNQILSCTMFLEFVNIYIDGGLSILFIPETLLQRINRIKMKSVRIKFNSIFVRRV